MPLDLNDALEKLAPEVSPTACIPTARTSGWLGVHASFSEVACLPAVIGHDPIVFELYMQLCGAGQSLQTPGRRVSRTVHEAPVLRSRAGCRAFVSNCH